MPEIHYVGKNGGRYIGKETLCGLSSRSHLPRKRMPKNDSYTQEVGHVTCDICMSMLNHKLSPGDQNRDSLNAAWRAKHLRKNRS